jgi:hypothetical protein
MGLNRNLGNLTEVIKENSGLIGMGLTPATGSQYKLDVVGSIRSKYAVNGSNISLQPDSTQVYLVASSSDSTYGDKKLVINSSGLSLRAMGTSTAAIEILSNGYVGIGTTSPSSKLHIIQSSFNPLRIARDSVSDYSFELGGSGEFYIKNNLNSVYPISILPGGNVGIATTSPDAIFTINKTNTNYTDASAGHILLDNSSSIGQSSIYYRINGTVRGKIRVDQIGTMNYIANGGEHSFWTNGDAGTGAERMRITSGGNVGVFNTLYGANNVRSDGAYGGIDFYNSGIGYQYSAKIYTLKNSTEFYGLTNDFGAGTSGQLSIVAKGGSSSNIGIYTDASERIRITGGGYVILNSIVYGNTVSSSPRTLYIDTVGGLGGISSVRKSKSNIENLSNIDWIYDLNTVSFNYRKKDEDGNYTDESYEDINYGLIAEDTAPIADFLINYNPTEDGEKEMVGIEYSRLITPMLKAIQELKAEIEILKNK